MYSSKPIDNWRIAANCSRCELGLTLIAAMPRRLLTKWRAVVVVVLGLLLGYAILSHRTIQYMKPINSKAVHTNLFSVVDTQSMGSSRWSRTSKTLLPAVCVNESCRRDYAKHLQRGDDLPIPKIRHILWRNESVSAYFAQQLSTWQSIHPDWTYVLWRDQDLEPFVAANFPALLAKFKSLKLHIMRVDMIRFMLLLKFGGVYADLDYSLVQSLDEFRRFHALVTREPEAHSVAFVGLFWPIKPLASPAFLMSAPGHAFYRFVLEQLAVTEPYFDTIGFAGPLGLTKILEKYEAQHLLTNNSMETVYLPPSFSFYPYLNNSLKSSSSEFRQFRTAALKKSCKRLAQSKEPSIRRLRQVKKLTQLCSDVTNFDPITDSSLPVFAIHDVRKSGPSWDLKRPKRREYVENLTELKRVVRNLKLGANFDSNKVTI